MKVINVQLSPRDNGPIPPLLQIKADELAQPSDSGSYQVKRGDEIVGRITPNVLAWWTEDMPDSVNSDPAEVRLVEEVEHGVNAYLEEGWKLLHVYSGVSGSDYGPGQYPVYVVPFPLGG